jgi:hypothetical protein
MTTSFQIAAGHNNTAGLQGLHEISPPLFIRYENAVLTEWHDYEVRERTGKHTQKKLGLPWFVMVLRRVEEDERQLLRTTYFDGAEETTEVTVKTKNKRLDTYQIFNAIMEWPAYGDETFYQTDWRPMRVTFRDLKLYSAFDFAFDSEAFGV